MIELEIGFPQPEYRCDTKEQLLQLLGNRMENALGGIRVLGVCIPRNDR
jgi:hypothetical protein